MNILIENADLPREGEPDMVAFIKADGTVKYYKDARIVGLMAKPIRLNGRQKAAAFRTTALPEWRRP